MTKPAAPHRILMTVDAVGGVWRYAMDLARTLRSEGVETVFAGFGPPPSRRMIEEAGKTGKLLWSSEPLDWMAGDESALVGIPRSLAALASAASADLVHLNLPSQAAGLAIELPVVVVSHSCIPTWFAAVRGAMPPADWCWHQSINARGLLVADAVVAPSRSHADALSRCYGIDRIEVVHNASRHVPARSKKWDYCFAAARWWDPGKNAVVLDQVAALTSYPIVAVGPVDGPNGEHVRLQRVYHRGALDHRDAMALMDEAAIFLSPSIYEPFGLAALEAARSGAALVLSDIPTYRELWHEAALFVPPDDPRAFANMIDVLAVDRPLRQRLALAAEERSRQFSTLQQGRSMLAVYRRVMGQRSELRAAE